MCGLNLRRGVMFVGIITALVSLITLAYAMICVLAPTPEAGYNGHPVAAVNLIFGLYSSSVSFYQIAISLLLIWQATRKNGDIFICSVWYVSHLAIIVLYCLVITAKTTVCFLAKKYLQTVASTVAGLVYISIFIYFLIIVNSYSRTIDEIIYY